MVLALFYTQQTPVSDSTVHASVLTAANTKGFNLKMEEIKE